MLLASGESEVVANVTTLSYNVAMTTSRMAICPTRSEASIIGSRNGSGLIALDGTLLAGRLLVKTEEECISLRGYRKWGIADKDFDRFWCTYKGKQL